MAKDEQYGISEWGRNVGNFLSSTSPYSTANKNALKRDLGNVGAFFTSTKAKTTPKYSNNRNGAVGSADAMERRAKAAKAGKPSFGKSQGPIAGGQDQGETFEEMLARIMGAGGGGGGGGGGSRRAYSDEQVAATSAKLQALYNRYAADVAAREADIAGYYDKSATNLGSIYDTSASNVAKAYEAARAAQTQQLQALGLTEHTPVAQFGNETASITALNNLRAAVLAQNEASKGRAITNQRLASEAAQREGAQVAAKAAQAMAAEMVSTGGGGGGGGGGLSPYQYASLLLQNKKNEDTAAYNAAKVASSQKSQPSVQAALDAAANWKGTPDQLRAFEAFYGKV